MALRVLLASVLAIGSFSAAACSCVHLTGDIEEDVRFFWEPSTAVVAAVVVSLDAYRVEDPESSYPSEFQRASWRVTRNWKGVHEVGSTLVTDTEITCCMCGAEVSVGEEWVLYLQRSEPYRVSACSIGRQLSKSAHQVPILDRLSSRNGT
jgi:hypothetical protein